MKKFILFIILILSVNMLFAEKATERENDLFLNELAVALQKEYALSGDATSYDLTVPDGTICRGLYVGSDVNQNGLYEIILTSYSDGGKVHLFEVSADNVVSEIWTSPSLGATTGSTPRDVKVGDLDSNGDLEIIIPVNGSGGSNDAVMGLQIFEYTKSTESFDAPFHSIVDSDASANRFLIEGIFVSDVDKDGKDEVLIGNNGTGTFDNCYIVSFTGTFDAADAAPVIEFRYGKIDAAPLGGSVYPPIVGDMDGDGNLEVLCAVWDHAAVLIIEATGADTYEYRNLVQTDTWLNDDVPIHHSVQVADLDNNGKDEVYVSLYDTGALMGIQCTGELDSMTTVNSVFMVADHGEAGGYGLAVGDIDNNGKTNLYTAAANSSVISHEFQGGDITVKTNYTATTLASHATASGTFAVMTSPVDLDGDGNEELVVTYTDGGATATVGASVYEMIPEVLEPVIWEVAEGTDVLNTAIKSAADGDIIELTTDGGIYAESGKFSNISNSITIRAAAGLTNKPIIRTADADYMFKLTGVNSRYVFEGIEIDGTNGTESSVMKYFLRVDNADPTGKMDIFVNDCYIHHSQDKFIKPYADSGIDTLSVINSIFHDGGKEGIVLYTGSSGDPAVVMNDAIIENCTFYDIKREAVKGQTHPDTKVIIDRNTFYNVGYDNKAMVYFRNMTNVEVKNSIFVNHNADGDKFADFESEVSLFHNNVVFDVLNTEVGKATIADTLHVDPAFADAVNGDFSLPEGSELLTYADDGGAIGDPRWAPAATAETVHQVAAGTGVLSAAISAAGDGDVIELTTSGGIYDETTKFLSISQSITIRAAEGLAVKPVIRTPESDYMFKLTGVNSRYVFKGVEIDGTNGTGSAVVKYFLRIDNADPTGTADVIVDDVYVHHMKDKFIKPYGNTGMDTLSVTNSIFHDGASEGITLYSGSSGDPAVVMNDAIIENCTFYNLEREAIKGQTHPGTVVRVNHCTFYNLGENDKKAMIYFRDMTDVVVKNSIFSVNNNADAEKFADFASDVSLFHNNVVWETTNFTVGNATVTDTLVMDPMFTDPANGDFSFPSSSVMLTYGDDGSPLGDPRWAPLDGKYILNVFTEGNGTVTLDPAGGIYDSATVVTMTAVADEYYAFDHWSENVAVFPPTNPVAQMKMLQNEDVVAYFVPTIEERQIVIDSIGLGHVEIEKISNFNVEGYYETDSLVLTPVADTLTWEFAYWVNEAGDSLDNTAPLSYKVAEVDTFFIAMFRSTLPQVTLIDSVEGMGSIAITPKPVPGFTTYDVGQEVTLTATAVGGWELTTWKGDASGEEATIILSMDADKMAIAEFTEIAVPNGELMVDATWDLRDALAFAKNNSQVEMIKLIEEGPYTLAEEDRVDGKIPYLNIDFPVTIAGAESVKPIIKGWGEGGSEGFFRLRANGHLTLDNLVIDGYFSEGVPTKYIVRSDDGSDSIHVSLKATNCDFMGTKEVFFKNYAGSNVDTLSFVNCTISEIGKEMIYLKSVGNASYIELKNSTFTHVGRQMIYLFSMSPKIVVDHVTIDSSGYGYGSEGAKFPPFRCEGVTDMSVTNTIVANMPFDGVDYTPYAVRITGENSIIDNCLFYNVPTKLDMKEGAVAGPDNYWYDPMFARTTPGDLTLTDGSVAYHLAGDGSVAIGDPRWATSTNVTEYTALNLVVGDDGEVIADPAPMAKFYVPQTVVTLTADADTLYKFAGWSGDVTGTDPVATVTMDADKSVEAAFDKAYYYVKFNVNMNAWAAMDKFSPGVDSVDFAGNMNGWGNGPLMTDEDEDGVYYAGFKVDENYPDLEWKFRINRSWDDDKSEFPSGGPNRTLTLTDDVELTYWFNDDQPEPDPLILGEFDIANPGFEDGLGDWSVWPTSDTHHELANNVNYTGINSLKMTGASVSVYQALPTPEPGKAYVVHGYAMNPSSDPLEDGQILKMEITFFDAAWNHVLQDFSDPLTSESVQDEWQKLSYSAVCPEGAVNVNVAFNWTGTESTTGSAYCDDISAYIGAIPLEIENLSLEEDEDFWSWDTDAGWGTWCYEPENEGVLIDETVSRSGVKSAKIMTQNWTSWGDPWNWGGYWGGMNQWVMQTVEKDDWYYTSAWVMTPATGDSLTGNVEIYAEMKYQDFDGSELAKYVGEFNVTPSSTKDTWHHIHAMGPATTDNTAWIECNIYMGQYGEATGVAYMDDFMVINIGGELPDVSIDDAIAIPSEISLSQNYPNPFNPSTTIGYTLPEQAKVTLKIFDLIGREVKTLVNENQGAGYKSVIWDGRNNDGEQVSTGCYFYNMKTDNFSEVRKMLFMK